MPKNQKFKERLEDEKQRLQGMISSRRSIVQDNDSVPVNESFSNSGDEEYADAATDLYTRELDSTMLDKYKYRITMIDGALGRMEKGQYGTCIRCHQAISEARLDAIPETAYCRDCEADVEVEA